MKNAKFLTSLLVLVAFAVSFAQDDHFDESNILELEKYVLILKDGEQIVIRGVYEVKGDQTYFYYDHGRYPTYSSLPSDLIDFPGSDEANATLQRDRQRRENYFRLIEERRRKILEESSSSPVVVTSNVSGFSVSEEETVKQGALTIAQQFPQYQDTDVEDRPENWWRNEAYRLFAALETSNKILRELSEENNRLTVASNRARTNAEGQRIQEQINQVRAQMVAERERGSYVGYRLAELSEWAEELEIPLDWIIPDGSVVYDDSFSQEQQPVETDSSFAETNYSGLDLGNVPDSWWQEEEQKLQRFGNETIQRLIDLRKHYNEILALREKADSDGEKIRLQQQMEAVENSISQGQVQLHNIERSMQRLLAEARKFGKVYLLGLMTERK